MTRVNITMDIVRGVSIDYDGSFSQKGNKGNIIEQNQPLLDLIKAKNDLYNHNYLFIGSNRQSVRDDNANSGVNQNGACYPQFIKISNYLKAHFDRFLLTDLYNDLLDGEAFDFALSLLDDNHIEYNQAEYKATVKMHFDWLHDESKLSVLIAQIQKLACKHPNDAIEFYFFDDKEEILNQLYSFFQLNKNRQLLPKNLKELKLFLYAGEMPKLDEKGDLDSIFPPIIGEGEIDFNYSETIKQMADVCIKSLTYQSYDPTGPNFNRVMSYQDAKNVGFDVPVVNFIRDYLPPQEKNEAIIIAPIPQLPKKHPTFPPLSKSELVATLSSLFNINKKKLSSTAIIINEGGNNSNFLSQKNKKPKKCSIELSAHRLLLLANQEPPVEEEDDENNNNQLS